MHDLQEVVHVCTVGWLMRVHTCTRLPLGSSQTGTGHVCNGTDSASRLVCIHTHHWWLKHVAAPHITGQRHGQRMLYALEWTLYFSTFFLLRPNLKVQHGFLTWSLSEFWAELFSIWHCDMHMKLVLFCWCVSRHVISVCAFVCCRVWEGWDWLGQALDCIMRQRNHCLLDCLRCLAARQGDPCLWCEWLFNIHALIGLLFTAALVLGYRRSGIFRR